MAFWAAVPVLGKIIEGIIGLVDQAVEDKDEANRIKAELTKMAFTQKHEEFVSMLDNQTKIILAEAQGVRVQQQYKQEYLGYLVTADNIFGTAEMRDYAGISIIVPA